jgi:Mrp family chromosome partitioning ATPase
MLDALKQAQSRRGQGQAGGGAPTLQAVWPEEAQETADVPFVEVGGPHDVQKAAKKPMVSPASACAAEEEPRLMTVLFRSLSPEAVSGHGRCSFAAELVAYHQPHHAISGQYRAVVAGLLGVLPAEQAHVLLFTSAVAAAGTTTVLLNTAITLARQGGRVVVVDAHLRRPAVAERLGVPEAPGLRDVLANRLPLADAVRGSGLPNLSVLAAGHSAAASPVRLAGEGMRSVLRQLREQFDLVLVDGPRWDGRPEVVALGCACDAVYLCLPEAEQAAPEITELIQIIPEQGAALCGCVLTSR